MFETPEELQLIAENQLKDERRPREEKVVKDKIIGKMKKKKRSCEISFKLSDGFIEELRKAHFFVEKIVDSYFDTETYFISW